MKKIATLHYRKAKTVKVKAHLRSKPTRKGTKLKSSKAKDVKKVHKCIGIAISGSTGQILYQA